MKHTSTCSQEFHFSLFKFFFFHRLGHRREFILPDRKRYVTMDEQFLKSYLHLVIKVTGKSAKPKNYMINYAELPTV